MLRYAKCLFPISKYAQPITHIMQFLYTMPFGGLLALFESTCSMSIYAVVSRSILIPNALARCV